MKYRLQSLLVFVTVCGIAMAVALHRANHREKVRQYRIAFNEVGESIRALEPALEQQIRNTPAVRAQLQASNPIDPAMAMSYSIMGHSQSYGSYQFTRKYHYDWQSPDGARADGISITIASTIDELNFGKHIVRLIYAPNELNRGVARWLETKLSSDERLEIRHVTDSE